MAKASPLITSLNAGELSPTMDGRVDIEKYPAGMKLCQNFISLPQGPAVRRPGSRFVAEAKDSTKRVWLRKFEFSATQCFIIEFGDRYARFYTNHGQLLTGSVTAWSNATNYVVGDLAVSGGMTYYCILAHINQVPPNATYWYPLTGSIYEIPTPWALADLTNSDGSCALNIEQSGDVLYITNMYRTYEPQQLIRYSNTKWVVTPYRPVAGPFSDENSTSTTIYASAQTGTVNLVASASVFASTDVNRLIRIQVQNLDVKPWQSATAYVIGDLVQSDGKVYKALNSATSGVSQPLHLSGNAYDGKVGVQWAYQDANYGVARIATFTDSQHVSATVLTDADTGLQQLPANIVGVGNATARWRLGAWSASTEYPATVTLWKNRLWFGGRLGLWASVPDDFSNMAGDFFGETSLDNALWTQVQAQDVNAIVWLLGADRLLIGTGGGEFIGGEITTTQALGPGNFEITRQSKFRSRGISPLIIGSTVCYIQRAGRKLMGMNYSYANDKYQSGNLVILSDRITRGGIIDIAYQAEPWSVIWSTRSDGRLIAFTYDSEQNVTGWHRHPLGGSGIVESIAIGPAPDGSRDEIWLSVRRTINGVTKRYIEYIEKPWEGADIEGIGSDVQADAFYVDCGLTYSGAAATTISGLTHLEGQTVQVLADGASHPDRVVASGAITLDRSATNVQVGLQAIARIVPMRIDAGSQDGTSQGKIKRVHALTVRFLDTLGGLIGPYGGTLDSISLRSPSTPMGTAPPIASGDMTVDFPGDYDRDAFIEIRQDQPFPMTVVAIAPKMRTYDP